MIGRGGRVLPSASVAMLALLAVLPWGLPANARFVLPFLPVAAIYYWSSRHPERLSAWVPFLAGLLVDVLTNGPLGYWPLVYLSSGLLGSEAYSVGSGVPGGRWAAFLISLLAVVTLGWGVAGLYHLALADWRPFAWAVWFVALAFPLLVAVFKAIDPQPERAGNERFERGA